MPQYKHVPKGFSQTEDCFVGCLIGAPLFGANGMTIEQAFGRLVLGIDSVIAKAKKPEALRLLTEARSEVLAVRDMFQENSERIREKDKAARLRLQRAYYDFYKRAGQVLRPGWSLALMMTSNSFALTSRSTGHSPATRVCAGYLQR